MYVDLFHNTKRLNSTKAAPSTHETVDCVFKHGTSILNPVLIITYSGTPDFNYMQWSDRYYWVTDIISSKNDLWEIHGSLDVLTTYRNHILNTTAFVLYDSTANTQLPDPRLAIKTDCDAYTASTSMPWGYDDHTGTYLISTTGDTSYVDFLNKTITQDQRAGTGTYTISKLGIEMLGFDLQDWMLLYAQCQTDYTAAIALDIQKFIYTSGQDLLDYIAKCIQGAGGMLKDSVDYAVNAARLITGNLLGGGSALSNVKASYWLPFTIPDMVLTPVNKPLALGAYADVVAGLKRVNDAFLSSVLVDVAIPWHYTDWRNVSCTEVMLYIPLIGCINIPSEVVKGNNTLQLKFSLNVFSGALAVEVRCDGATIGTYGANVSCPILIGDSNVNVSGITNTIASAVTKKYAGAVANGLQSLGEMSTSVGGLGGGAGCGLGDQIVCICRCHDTSQDPAVLRATIGTPTNELKALATGLGYVQCMNAQLNTAAVSGEPDPNEMEITKINQFLNNGVYLE